MKMMNKDKRVKLNDKQKAEIRQMKASSKISNSVLAILYNVSERTIMRVVDSERAEKDKIDNKKCYNSHRESRIDTMKEYYKSKHFCKK